LDVNYEVKMVGSFIALAVFLREQISLLATPNLGLHGKSRLR